MIYLIWAKRLAELSFSMSNGMNIAVPQHHGALQSLSHGTHISAAPAWSTRVILHRENRVRNNISDIRGCMYLHWSWKNWVWFITNECRGFGGAQLVCRMRGESRPAAWHTSRHIHLPSAAPPAAATCLTSLPRLSCETPLIDEMPLNSCRNHPLASGIWPSTICRRDFQLKHHSVLTLIASASLFLLVIYIGKYPNASLTCMF